MALTQQTGNPPEPGAGDDAAADAGHQAAAALESGPRGLCRGRARAQSAARARRRRRGDVPSASGAEPSERERRRGRTTTASADWMGDDLEPAAAPIEDAARHRPRQRVSRRCRPGRASARQPTIARRPIRNGPAPAPAAREDGDYNLEAFVSAERTLADHLAEQLALAIADPVRRMIGQYLIDHRRRGRLPHRRSRDGRREARRAAGRSRGGARRSCRPSIRPASARAISPNAWRSSSRSATASIRRCRRWSAISICWPSATSPALRKHLRRRRRGSRRHDRRDPPAQSEARPRLRLDHGAADRARRVRAPGPDGGLHRSSSIPTRCRRCWSTRRYYAERRQERAKNDSDKTYLAECLQSATWLVRALDQRAKTILKVATEIVRQQDGFFAHGVQHLRPLNLKTVADAISMHESTVSRVTANKYMATNRGIFELKYFFTSVDRVGRRRRRAFRRGGAPPHQAADRRRERRATCCRTTPSWRSCASAGIDIARRTVAKYREAMRIPSSVQRRRDKQAGWSAVANARDSVRMMHVRDKRRVTHRIDRPSGASVVGLSATWRWAAC